MKVFLTAHLGDAIADEIRKIAKDFCMDAEDILGYVLKYRFDMECYSIYVKKRELL